MPKPLMPSQDPPPEAELSETVDPPVEPAPASIPVDEPKALRAVPTAESEPEERRQADNPEPSFKPIAKVPTEGGILPPPRILNRRKR